MELLSKIRLSWRFGKIVYIISGILTIGMAVLVAFRPLSVSPCIAIKAMSIPVIYYMNANFTKGIAMYFYLNLGFSKMEYRFLPFILDFTVFALLIIITGSVGYAVR